MKKVIAFADEFGNNSFDFETQGSHFIIASVIINQDELEEIKIQLEEVRKRFFQTGEIKSNKVSKNHKNKLELGYLLNELNKLEIYSQEILKMHRLSEKK